MAATTLADKGLFLPNSFTIGCALETASTASQGNHSLQTLFLSLVIWAFDDALFTLQARKAKALFAELQQVIEELSLEEQ